MELHNLERGRGFESLYNHIIKALNKIVCTIHVPKNCLKLSQKRPRLEGGNRQVVDQGNPQEQGGVALGTR